MRIKVGERMTKTEVVKCAEDPYDAFAAIFGTVELLRIVSKLDTVPNLYRLRDKDRDSLTFALRLLLCSRRCC